MKKRDFRIISLYEFKRGHKATDASAKINSAFGKPKVNERTEQRWFNEFRSGNTSLKKTRLVEVGQLQ
jgi:hypothetical protein